HGGEHSWSDCFGLVPMGRFAAGSFERDAAPARAPLSADWRLLGCCGDHGRFTVVTRRLLPSFLLTVERPARALGPSPMSWTCSAFGTTSAMGRSSSAARGAPFSFAL